MAVTVRSMPLGTNRDAGGDTLLAWAERSGSRLVAEPRRGGLGFVFYGRVSTEDHQDPVTSRARRPEAAALVAAMADPGRGFDAIVVGEYERAFLWQPVQPDGAVVRALRRPAVDARGRRPNRFSGRGTRADDDRAGYPVEAGDHPGPGSG